MRFHIKYRTKIVKITFSFGEWRGINVHQKVWLYTKVKLRNDFQRLCSAALLFQNAIKQPLTRAHTHTNTHTRANTVDTTEKDR